MWSWKRRTPWLPAIGAGSTGERIVRSELRSRGLPEPPPPIDRCWKCGRAVHKGEPGDACSRCGEPFSASIRAKLEGPASAREADPADAEEPDFVYRSRYLHEVEMVCEHLEREGLAFYQSEEAMGVRYAMPAAPPVATLPGAWFLVIVPAAHAERAAEIVDALPISHGDDDEPATGLAGVRRGFSVPRTPGSPAREAPRPGARSPRSRCRYF